MSILRSARACALLTMFASLALVGCMKINEKNVLSKDGSGTATLTMSMDKAKIKEMEDFAKGFGGGEGESSTSDDFDVEKVKEKYGKMEGIEVVSVDPIDDEKNKGVKVVLKYTSLEKYFASGAAGGSEGQKVTLAEKDGAWTLTRESSQDMEGGEEMAGMMATMMAGLDVSMSIEVPGTITETSGKKNDAGNVVTWTLTDKDLTDKTKMAAMKKMTVTFKGEGLALQAFTVEVKEKKPVEETMGETK
jgi:hypothetical protein